MRRKAYQYTSHRLRKRPEWFHFPKVNIESHRRRGEEQRKKLQIQRLQSENR